MPKRSKPAPKGPVSPDLGNAKRAVVRYDSARKPTTQTPGRWITKILTPNLAITDEHLTEAQARAWIGLTGGSEDPSYRPPDDSAEIAKGGQ